MIRFFRAIALCAFIVFPIVQSTRCYRGYGSLIFKPIEFWQEQGEYGQMVFRINEFYDFPHGFYHQEHQYEYSELCWRGMRFITDFQLHPFVPQVDRDEWYDGCQVLLRRDVFVDLKIVCDISEEDCLLHQDKHPIAKMDIKMCVSDLY